MKHSLFSWLVLGSSVTVAVLLAVNFLWLRRLARKLLHAQILFYKAAALLQKAQKQRAAEMEAAGEESAVQEGRRTAMSVEGHEIEIVEVDGKEVVYFDEEASEEERIRIMNYLKNEGFLP
ncbi:MAG: hypothetical protein PW734_00315 [Verrucomicrobium sp.]|nr:hypothetical protein [Verrucomicrobium sp.]